MTKNLETKPVIKLVFLIREPFLKLLVFLMDRTILKLATKTNLL